MRIVCVGGGPAGLYFAILMKERDREHEITVLERNPAGVTYGWGVVFWDDLLDQLYASDPTTATEMSSNAFRWNGQLLAVEGKDPAHVEGHGYGIGRHRLLDLLRERAVELGVQVRFEHEIEDLSQLPDGDLIVACDGVNSRLRQLHAADFKAELRTGRNKYIWLARRRSSIRSLLRSSRQPSVGSGPTPTPSTMTRARSSSNALPRRGPDLVSTGWTRTRRSRFWSSSSSRTLTASGCGRTLGGTAPRHGSTSGR